MALDAWIKELAEPQHKNYLLATVLDGPEPVSYTHIRSH